PPTAAAPSGYAAWSDTAFFTSFSAAWKSLQTTLLHKVGIQKNLALSALTRCANQRLHVIQIALKRAPACCRQTVLRLGQPPIKRFCAHDVVRFFELTCVHAQISI